VEGRYILVIGLTGGIGTGKSTALKVFKKLGAHTIDADTLARQAVRPGAPAWREIRENFGAGVFHKNGRLNRKELARAVFGNAKALAELNAIVHPHVFSGENRAIAALRAKDKNAVVVVDAALMIETGSHRGKDVVVVMASTPQNQLNRLCVQNRYTRAAARARIRSQMPLEEKLKRADYVIENNGTLARLRKNAADIFEQILADRGLPPARRKGVKIRPPRK